MVKIFVYGTLKRGFPLHDVALRDASYLGDYETTQTYPLVIGGPWYGPMMFDEPSVGLSVRGELFEIADDQLHVVDNAENMGEPGNYRSVVEVTSVNGGTIDIAVVYTKARSLAEPHHSGLIADYQDRRFVPPWQR